MAAATDTGISNWITRLKNGDGGAVRPLWDAYFDRLVRYVRSRVRPAGDVDPDGIAASAFKSFWAAVVRGHADRLADRDDLWGLLTLITRRKIVRMFERRATAGRGKGWVRLADSEIDRMIDSADGPELQAAWAEEFRQLIDSLGDSSLQVVLLRKLDGCTNDEIRRELGCTVRTVSNKIRLIRLSLRAHLSPGED